MQVLCTVLGPTMVSSPALTEKSSLKLHLKPRAHQHILYSPPWTVNTSAAYGLRGTGPSLKAIHLTICLHPHQHRRRQKLWSIRFGPGTGPHISAALHQTVTKQTTERQ